MKNRYSIISKFLVAFTATVFISTSIMVFAKHIGQQGTQQQTIPSNISKDLKSEIADLSSLDPVKRAAAAYSIGRDRSKPVEAIPFLIAILGDGVEVDPNLFRNDRNWCNDNEWCKSSPGKEAANALAEIGKPSVAPLIQALGDSQSLARTNAAWALGAIGDERALQPLLDSLRDEASTVRAQSAWALGAFGRRFSSETVEPLIQTLSDHEPKVRQQVAWALGAIGDRRAAEALTVALKDEDFSVRSQAAWACGAIGAREAVPGLIEALKDNNVNVRKQSAWALGAIGDKRAADGLGNALKDENAGVRMQLPGHWER